MGVTGETEFVEPVDTYRLRFEGRWAGLEVVCREGSLEQIDAIGALPDETPADPAERAAAFRALCEAFAPALVGWNLTDPVTRAPVPATLAGLRSRTVATVQAIVGAWLDAVLLRTPRSAPAGQDVDEDLEESLAALSAAA